MRARRIFLLLLFLFSLHQLSIAQSVKVKGGFLSDSTRVGDHIQFYLTAKYPVSLQVVFPDTSYSYKPFEFKKKNYFTTKTSDSLSYDSAVYTLRTFEIYPKQVLSLPVFIIAPMDSTQINSNTDTVALRNVVIDLPDSLGISLPLKATVAYQEVSMAPNFALIAGILLFLLLLTGIAWIGFGKSISQYLRRRRMTRLHGDFIRSYNGHLEEVRRNFSPKVTESALVLWKRYMENLNRKPYTKLTTHETMLIEKDEALGSTLRNIDSAIYGPNNNVLASLESLRAFADQRFSMVISEVNNGK